MLFRSGRMVEHKISEKGLWIKARVSAAAEVFNLVKDEVITAFSVGFRILDAEYNALTELFVVKELELIEISVVSVPCNQNTLFSLSKAFTSAEEYSSFKSQFAPKSNSAKGLESLAGANSKSQKEWKMNPEEIKQMLADAAKTAAEEATKSLLLKSFGDAVSAAGAAATAPKEESSSNKTSSVKAKPRKTSTRRPRKAGDPTFLDEVGNSDEQ